jgi:hypothetical protein
LLLHCSNELCIALFVVGFGPLHALKLAFVRFLYSLLH